MTARDIALRRDMQRLISEADERADKRTAERLAAAIAAVNDKQRRASNTVNFTAAGSQQMDITWAKPFPDEFYGVWVTLYTSNPAQVHCVPLPATKTASGITLTIVAASAVGDVTADVLAVRTA